MSTRLFGIGLALVVSTVAMAAEQPAPPKAGELRAGVAKVEITNKKVIPANDPLYVKALVLKNDVTTAVLVTLDAVAVGEIGPIGSDYLGKVRARLQKELAISPRSVIVNASHCHGIVCADVDEKTIEAVKAANANLVPVKVGVGVGSEARISENRRLRLKSGKEADVRHAYAEARCMEVYAAMIDNMDQGIGRIVEALRDTGEYDNTLVFFLQDNGGCAEPFGRAAAKTQKQSERGDKPTFVPMKPEELPKAMVPPQTRDGWPVLMGPGVLPGPADTFIAYGQGWANVSNTPFREYKHWVHEGGISTPLIAHWPAGIKAKSELRHQPGHLIDIMATCVDVAGAKYPVEHKGSKLTPLAGRSLVPAFTDRPIEREAIYWEHEGNRAVRIGKWKAVAKSPAGKWELYDMEADRTELHDLAAQESERLKDMAAKWESWATKANVLPWIWEPAYRVK